jgi:hypothetical protein
MAAMPKLPLRSNTMSCSVPPPNGRETRDVKQVEVGCMGVGWFGGLRA